jgi:hypothetical protein
LECEGLQWQNPKCASPDNNARLSNVQRQVRNGAITPLRSVHRPRRDSQLGGDKRRVDPQRAGTVGTVSCWELAPALLSPEMNADCRDNGSDEHFRRSY